MPLKYTADVPNDRQRKALAEHGETLLRMFHDEYEANPVGADTEFRPGHFTEWRHMLDLLYGEATAQKMIEAVSKKTLLSIPPAGPLAPSGDGYLGWDSGCHMGFIGRFDQ